MIGEHLDMESEFGPVLENLNAQLSQREIELAELTTMLVDERRAHQACHEQHEEQLHQMRVIGYAQGIAFIRDGMSWGHLCQSHQAEYLQEAEKALSVLDSNNP